MNQSIDQVHRADKPVSDYDARLNQITSRQLTARNIDTFADDALEELTKLVDDVVSSMPFQPPFSPIENERQALAKNGLQAETVELTLDHIATVAESTKRLDSLITKKTKLVDVVLVPPDSDKAPEITTGDGSFEKPKERIPKLKTLLLLLETEFGIDLESKDDLPDFEQGPLRPNMMRSTSYKLIQLPTLERTVLICDEIGNTTFVFDQKKCNELNITPSDLYELTKDELRELIDQLEIGEQINYSNRYVEQLASALQEPSEVAADSEGDSVAILKPKETIEYIPAGYVIFSELAEQIGITVYGLEKRIAKIDEAEFGAILKYREPGKGGVGVRILSPEQRAKIDYEKWDFNERLINDDNRNLEDGSMLFNDFANALGIHPTTLKYRAERLRDEIGEIEIIPGGSRGLRIVSSSQQVAIRNFYTLQHKEIVLPEGYVTGKEIADELSITVSGLFVRISKLDEDAFGEKRYLPTGHIILSPAQQTMLREQYPQIYDEVPNGYITSAEYAKFLGIATGTLHTKIRNIDSATFGQIQLYRKPGRKQSPSYILSPEQQAILKSMYDGVIREMPDKYAYYDDVARELGINKNNLLNRIRKCDKEEFGEILKLQSHAGGTAPRNILSPRQQEILRAQDRNIKRRIAKKVLSDAQDT